MKYEFYCTPAIANMPNGKIIVGVSPNIPYTPETYEEILKEYSNRENNKTPISNEKPTFKIVTILSKSDPEKKYNVTVFSDGQIKCECKGYSFRRSCSHIDKVKKQIKDGIVKI